MLTGADIVKITRMESLLGKKMPNKVFGRKETDYINSKRDRLTTGAGIFAAKEAVSKCLGTGITLPLCDICIDHEESGRPCVRLRGRAYTAARNMGITDILISISHDGDYAIATAVAKVDDNFCKYKMAVKVFENAPDNAITPEMIRPLLPERPRDCHKGDCGRLFVLAGSEGLTGAAILACTSALKCGAGLITLGCARELNPIFECALTEVMTKPLNGKNGMISLSAGDEIAEFAKKSDTCLIGPGLGRSRDITELVKYAVKSQTRPMIVDADGLYALSQNPEILKDADCPLVLTPHLGEFATLTGMTTEEIKADLVSIASEYAKKHSLTLVVKSHETLVCTKDGAVYRNLLGNPGMATGGSGDVLAGVIASFSAQGRTPAQAALLGVYIHSLAADMAAMDTGEYSLTPEDIINHLAYAIKYSQSTYQEMKNS